METQEQGEGVSEQFLYGTSAHIRLFSALPCYGRFTYKEGDIIKAI